MNIHYYLEGTVIPLRYDYILSVEGIMEPSMREGHMEPEAFHIVLEKGDVVPTIGQRQTIRLVRRAFPSFELHFHFDFR